MSTTVPNNAVTVETPSRAQLVAAHADWRRIHSIALPDHAEGRHVGFDADDVACGACMSSGDMPDRPSMTRSQYLERNITEAILLMRMRAAIASFEVA